MSTVSKYDQIVDSRDIIARMEELEGLCAEGKDAEDGSGFYDGDTDLSDEKEELDELKALADEASGSPDWQYGEGLISDTYFPEYAQELARDIGAINDEMAWPCSCIDWERAANELKMDYFSVDWGGEEFWLRA